MSDLFCRIESHQFPYERRVGSLNCSAGRMEETLADPPVDGGYPVLTRRSARLMSSDVCDPRVMWLLSTVLVGRGCPLRRLVHFYPRPPVNRAHIASRVPVGLYPRVMKHFLHATGYSRRNRTSCPPISLRPAWYVATLNGSGRSRVPAKTSGTWLYGR